MGFDGLARRVLPPPVYDSLVFKLAERRMARTERSAELASGPPLPPAYLQVLVAGEADGPAFLARGEAQARSILDMAGEHGFDADRPASVLDWGCGCGRIARWIAPHVQASGGRFTGSDLNPALVRWCQANLPGRYERNGLKPPLRVPRGSQDLLYAYSVVTHLTLPVVQAWLAELGRVVRPGGLALVSFHDEDWPCPDRAALLRDGVFVTTRMLEGSNHMATFVTRSRFAALCAEAFEVAAVIPSDVASGMQAWIVLRAANGPNVR